MTLKTKITGAIFTAYLGLTIGGAIWSSHLTDNFNYAKKTDNGLVIEVENRMEREKIVPDRMIVTHGKSYLVGRDSDDNGSLDKIVLSIKSKDAAESLLPLATEERLTQIYKEIIDSKEYLETIKKRQGLGSHLIIYSLFLGLIGLIASNGYKYSHATPEQLSNPLFHCR